jgi:PKD repeat protein
MKKLCFLITIFCFVLTSEAQTINPDFLDGRIVFKLKIDEVVTAAKQRDKNDFSLALSLADYPEIANVFEGITVTKFEKPSYFTSKPSLQTIFRIHFNDFEKIDDLIKQLSSLPNIEFAEKEPIYKIDFVPNDTYHSGNNKWYHTLVGSENAWNISQGSSTVKIAIIDNAVFCGHADLTTYAQYDVADNDNNATPPLTSSADFGWSHGTHCAGLATADINNGMGIASLGGNVQLIGVKCTPNSATNSGSVWYSYQGIQWACENGANVVSMSFGGSSYSAAIQSLINAYPDVVFLAAAGNDNVTTLMYPGAYNNVICVGSVDANDNRSSFSNYNGSTPFVDIASPGGYSYGGLYSTVYTTNGNGYAQMGGTSMATPFAAGLVGLMLSINPTLTPSAIQNCLITTGVNINQNIGPRINAPSALQCVQATLTGDPIPYFSGTPVSIIEGDFVTYADLSANGGNAITSYSWSFPGGTPSTFVGQNPPPIQYNVAGIYSATLTVTNSQSTQSYTRTNYINVSIPPYGEWLVQNSGFTAASRGINHISIVDANTVWATAYDGSGTATNIQQFTKTTDGGVTWTPGTINIQNANLGISMIHAASASKAWLAAYPNAAGQIGGIWITTNGGTTWTRQNTATFNNAASFTNAVHFWDELEGVCMGDPINNEFEIYRTTNGGTTWTLVGGANIPNPQANEFGYTRQMEVVGNNVWFGTSKGRIYYSSNKGQTWSVFTSPVTDFGGAVVASSSANMSFTSTTNGMIINQAGNVWTTTNSGSTWTPVSTTGTVYTGGLCYIEGTNVAFSTGAATGASGSSYSTNGGATWNLIDNQQHLYVDFINPSVGWSGWFNTSATQNGMWKWNDLSSALDASFSSASLTVCTNQQVNYTDQTTGAVPTSWNWLFPGGNPSTSSLQNPVVTYSTPGTYGVTLTVSDGISQTTVVDTAYITAVGPAAAPSVITGPNSVCANTANTFSVTNDPNVVYNWTFPATWTGTSTTNSIILTADATGGTVAVTAENVCGNSIPSALIVTTMPGSPIAGFSYTNNSGSVTFSSSSIDAANWSWDFGDGNSSNVENPNHLYTSNGSYTVSLVVANGCGNDTIIQTINVNGLGIEESGNSQISIFPIPVTENLNILLPDYLVGSSAEIWDMSGKKVANFILNSKDYLVDFKSFSPGVYLLKIGDLYIEKVIKK